MTEPKFKLGDDGELEEIIEDFDEKPKRKRKLKPRILNRTLYIPMSLMLGLILSIVLLGLITFLVIRPSTPQPQLPSGLPNIQLRPSETPGGFLDHIPPCGLLPVSQKPRFSYVVRKGTGDSELMRIDADGSNNCRLTNNNFEDKAASWSPDGKQIAFSAIFYATGYESEYSLYVANANGENWIAIAKGYSSLVSPSWSPDGKKIAFSGQLKGSVTGQDIYVVNVDGTNLIKLTDDPRIDSGPNWSPDGQSIVFESDRTFQPNVKGGVSQPNSYEIYMMDANGHNIRQLTFNKITDVSPNWSPDVQSIAFQSDASIHVMDKDGQHEHSLTNNVGASAPFWVSDTSEVGFTTNVGDIHFVNIYSGQRRVLPVPGNPSFVAPWWPPAVSPQPNV